MIVLLSLMCEFFGIVFGKPLLILILPLVMTFFCPRVLMNKWWRQKGSWRRRRLPLAYVYSYVIFKVSNYYCLCFLFAYILFCVLYLFFKFNEILYVIWQKQIQFVFELSDNFVFYLWTLKLTVWALDFHLILSLVLEL